MLVHPTDDSEGDELAKAVNVVTVDRFSAGNAVRYKQLLNIFCAFTPAADMMNKGTDVTPELWNMPITFVAAVRLNRGTDASNVQLPNIFCILVTDAVLNSPTDTRDEQPLNI